MVRREPPIWSAERAASTWELLGMTGHADDCPAATHEWGTWELVHSDLARRVEAHCAECGGLMAFLDDQDVVRDRRAIERWAAKLGIHPGVARAVYRGEHA